MEQDAEYDFTFVRDAWETRCDPADSPIRHAQRICHVVSQNCQSTLTPFSLSSMVKCTGSTLSLGVGIVPDAAYNLRRCVGWYREASLRRSSYGGMTRSLPAAVVGIPRPPSSGKSALLQSDAELPVVQHMQLPAAILPLTFLEDGRPLCGA